MWRHGHQPDNRIDKPRFIDQHAPIDDTVLTETA
jgi:hypothetical protein